jgi:hypothetical protein
MIENEGTPQDPPPPALLETKAAGKSKTILFNVAVAAFAILEAQTGLLRSYLSDGGYLALMMLVSAVNVYLRSITVSAVTYRQEAK